MSAVDSVDNCMLAQSCIDRYLWSLYERTRKIDTIKVPEQIKGTVKRRGKTRTVTKMITKLVDEDFRWKDPKAAERAGMLPMDYVIGGMDSSFRVTLYHALRALDDAETASKTSAPSSKSRPRFSRVVTQPSTSLPRLINLSGLPATLRAMYGKR
jgi:hypothetical protein